MIVLLCERLDVCVRNVRLDLYELTCVCASVRKRLCVPSNVIPMKNTGKRKNCCLLEMYIMTLKNIYVNEIYIYICMHM